MPMVFLTATAADQGLTSLGSIFTQFMAWMDE